ncbi:hypothetical protein [Nevskia ramosa]
MRMKDFVGHITVSAEAATSPHALEMPAGLKQGWSRLSSSRAGQ